MFVNEMKEVNEVNEMKEWSVRVRICHNTRGRIFSEGILRNFYKHWWEDQISNSTWMWRQGKACWLLTLPICGFLLELASPITVCLQRKKFPYLTWKLILLCLEHEPNSNFLKPSVDTVKGVRPASAVLRRSPGGTPLFGLYGYVPLNRV